MKKTTSLLATTAIVCSLALSSAAVAGMPTNSTKAANKTATSQKQTLVLYSFVIESGGAELKQVNGKNYTLSIPLANIKSVLAFAQAPARVAESLTPAQYAKMVHTGDDSFDKNPPNMAVTFDNGVSAAFEINSYAKDSTNITYTLTLLDQQEGPSNQTGHVSLFIDATFGVNTDTGGIMAGF